MRLDLAAVDDKLAQPLCLERAAVEQKAHSTRSAALCAEEVDADEATVLHAQAALLERLAPARLPRRLVVRFDLASGDRPVLLVGRLEDQKPAVLVADQGAGGGGNPRNVRPHPGQLSSTARTGSRRTSPGGVRSRRSRDVPWPSSIVAIWLSKYGPSAIRHEMDEAGTRAVRARTDAMRCAPRLNAARLASRIGESRACRNGEQTACQVLLEAVAPGNAASARYA